MSNLATIGWPSGTDTGWPSEPRNMLPGRIEGYPQGSQRSANTAERLLSQAVGWWDAAAYRDGDRMLRNRGVAGELLDLQLGSSDRVATTNDPLFLAPEDQGYVYLPGVAGNNLSVPPAVNLEITGDISLCGQVAPNSWATGSVQQVIGRYGSNVGNRSYALQIGTTGLLRFSYAAGGVTVNVNSTVAVPFTDGQRAWVACAVESDNGASGWDVRFFYSVSSSQSLPTSWIQLGSTVTTADAYAAPANPAIPVTIGGRHLDGLTVLAGNVYRAAISSAITVGGEPDFTTPVLDIDCDAITDGSATSFTAVTNQTVTINRSTTGRKSVAVPRRDGGGRSLFLLGTDDFFQCIGNWQHQLLNFDAQDSFTVVAVVRDFNWGNGAVISKSVTFVSASDAGYNLYLISIPGAVFYIKDGTVAFARQVNIGTQGKFTALFGLRNARSRRLSTYVDTLTVSPASEQILSGLATDVSFRVGRLGNSYAHMEFTAAAVFRRALTPDEIKTVTDYYLNRGY